MFEFIFDWWEKNGFTVIVCFSIVFFLVCWIMGFKSKKGRAGKLKDYINDIMGIKGSKKPRKKRNPKKTEEKCRSIVEDIFEKPFPSVRPDFLRNPATGRNLECDLMNENMKLCIERNGEQHYKHVEHFHNKDQFDAQIQRDILKKKLLAENGYTLISIPYTIHYDILEQYIPYKLAQDPRYKPFVDKWYLKNGIVGK